MSSLVVKSSLFNIENQSPSEICLSGKSQNKNIDVIPVSINDIFLCSGNILSLLSNVLINRGLNGFIPLAVRDLSSLVILAGESISSVKTVNEASTILSGVALTVTRLFILNKINSIPLLKPILLVMNVFGTYSVVHRAATELNKCLSVYKESKVKNNWNIARNIFVHVVNASCSIYNTYSIFNRHIEDLLEKRPSRKSWNKMREETPLRRSENKEKIPSIDSSQISNEERSFEDRKRKITVVTAYDNGIKKYADLVGPNQRNFAEKNKYGYVRYEGNLSKNRAPYWSKIVAIWDQLQKTKEGEWIAWMDASAVVTNTDKNFDQIIEKYGEGKDVILTTDPQVPINNAVFLVKNSDWSKDWIQKVWSRSDLSVGGEGNCGDLNFPHCHYEQQSMTELWEGGWNNIQSRTAIIPNKSMNSFSRYSHWDEYRDMQLYYGNDAKESKWAPKDFICKVTGMDKDRRYKLLKYFVGNCVDKDCNIPSSDADIQ